MAKSAHNDVLDALGNYLKTNGNKLTACEGEPTTFEHASSTKGTATGKSLSEHTLASGDYALADDTSGRKVTIAEQADIEVLATGDADHIAVVDTVNSKLLYVTTCTTQTLTDGNTVTFPAWKINVQDPS
jgi:hypothetical protein